MGNKAITAEALTKYYGKARGIDGLNLEVETGDFFGFIGPNGAGKSTTVKILSGILVPESGTVSVGGRTPWADRKAHVSHIGVAACIFEATEKPLRLKINFFLNTLKEMSYANIHFH